MKRKGHRRRPDLGSGVGTVVHLYVFGDASQILESFYCCRFCDVCGASSGRNECKKRCLEPLEVIRKLSSKGPKIIKK